MIRTIPIPRSVSRIGMIPRTPGDNCCSECAGNNMGSLGEVQCDPDGNCWDTSTGAYTPGGASVAAALTVSPSSAASTIGSWISGNSTLLVGLAAAVSVLAFATGKQGRRR